MTIVLNVIFNYYILSFIFIVRDSEILLYIYILFFLIKGVVTYPNEEVGGRI